MEIDKIIEEIIDEVLEEKKQPYRTEFKAFIQHVMMEDCSDEEVLERIRAIKTEESDSAK